MDSAIKEEEDLYRRVDVRPQFWKEECDRPSSALFKDSNGVSVDRSNNRSLEDIIKDEERLHRVFGSEDLKAVISVSKKTCEDKDIYVKCDPIDNNEHHCIIQRTESEVPLTSGQAKYLSKQCVIRKRYV
ncbi:hypothetical protein SDC9_96637 [bioreactor metagenome]|uniref:Uncharacterized protein n=1 Tax=bioreactor metagenome TaxID=1076179 RepID=A0A645AGE8_9ZZZZ